MDKKIISQKEYLKKYLSSGKEKKKIKKRKPNLGSKTVKIIDDDIDLKNMRAIEEGEFDILNNTEDAPQIAGIVEERGPVDFSDRRRWKIITDDGYGDISVTSVERNEASNSQNETAASNSTKHHSGSQESDYSPPRKTTKNATSDEPLRRKKSSKKTQRTISSPVQKHSSSQESDFSPPRKSKRNSDSDEPRKKKFSSKKHRRSTPSPVRNHSDSEDQDFSPPRRPRKNSDSDLSPPRNSKTQEREKEKYRSREKYSSNSLKKLDSRYDKRRENNSRNSRPRNYDERTSRTRFSVSPAPDAADSDRNFSRSRDGNNSYKTGKYGSRHHSFENDKSRRRSKQDRGKDESTLPRNGRRTDGERRRTNDHSRQSGNNSESDLSPPRENKKKYRDLDSESSLPKKNTFQNYEEMTAETSGFGQAPILRDRKTGRRRDLAAEAREQEEKDEKRQALEEKYAQWGRGLKQVEDQQQKLDRDLYEMSKPLARYADDADLERELKAQEREGDPMLAYMKRKYISEGKQEPEKPKYNGPSMPNRFGIRPGYRWDGVDRSNGYEKKWFDAQNARKAVQEEAYKWSTADM